MARFVLFSLNKEKGFLNSKDFEDVFNSFYIKDAYKTEIKNDLNWSTMTNSQWDTDL